MAQQPPVGQGLLIIEDSLLNTTVRRTPLDEWSVRHRDLYLTKHNTHKRQTSIPPAVFESMSISCINNTFFFPVALRPNAGHGLLIREVSRSHNDAPQSVGLLWTSDQLVAETSTWQHTTLTTDKHPCPDGIRTHDLSRRAAANLRLRPSGQWDRH